MSSVVCTDALSQLLETYHERGGEIINSQEDTQIVSCLEQKMLSVDYVNGDNQMSQRMLRVCKIQEPTLSLAVFKQQYTLPTSL